MDDSLDSSALEGSAAAFRLFEAYREGNLDCDVISTQKPTNKQHKKTLSRESPPTNAARDESNPVLPRSWCLPSSASKESSMQGNSFGKLCGSNNYLSTPAQVTETDTVSRAPYVAEPKHGDSPHKMNRGNAILVNQRQRGNPILKHIHNVAWEYAVIEPDYVVGRNHCAYFLSLRYHNLNPEYIFKRVRQTKQNYQLSVLLCQIDVTDPHYPLKELCKFCLSEKLTLMLAWNAEEAARYLEAYKALENKPPDGLMHEPANETDRLAQITDFLTAARPVTKADAISAVNKFETVADMILADENELVSCPGFGPRKAQKLYSVFRMPFKRELR
ncbi:unnamed protein product [Dicrocoelium dendriticum]|nr:unnamed protein product [Dicrocoelium dendriticum]